MPIWTHQSILPFPTINVHDSHVNCLAVCIYALDTTVCGAFIKNSGEQTRAFEVKGNICLFIFNVWTNGSKAMALWCFQKIAFYII